MSRRLQEIAFVLPWFGVLLLTPPAILVAQNWSRIAGLPLFLIYIFACWAGLILLGWRLSRRLARQEDEAESRAASRRRGEASD